MQYHASTYAENTWDVFWYEKNLFGDVVAVYNDSGTKLISYAYNAWGDWWSYSHNNGYDTAAYNNPFRYRGYYYDCDLGYYYLGSRYYDASVGRFINADGALYHNLLGYNMFAYCNNNPVNYVDYNGELAIAIGLTFYVAAKTVAAISAAVITAYVAATAVTVVAETVQEVIDYASANQAEDQTASPPQSVSEPEESVEVDEKGRPVVKPKQQPTEKEGYAPPKSGPEWVKSKDGKKSGWKDKNGNIWIPAPTGSREAHGGGHWDVQRPDGKGYTNVYPKGKVRHSKSGGKLPVF